MKRSIRLLFLTLVFAFLYAPIFVLILYSFNASRNQYKISGFTFDWYKNILTNDDLLNAIGTTITIAIVSTIISVIIGFISSVGILYLNKKSTKVALSLNNIPVINPDIVTGVSLSILFILVGVNFGFTSMLLAHISFSVPFVILAVLPKLREIGFEVVQAAQDLGLSTLQVVYKVLLPLSKTSIITGALMAFTMSIDDFVISYFTTGNGVSNLSIWIYAQTKRGLNPTANAVSTIMFLTVVILLVLMLYFNRKNKEEIYEII